MKVTYKNCEIEVVRGSCNILFYNVFDDEFEVSSGFSETSDTIRNFIKDLKKLVDDYREHPEEYEE